MEQKSKLKQGLENVKNSMQETADLGMKGGAYWAIDLYEKYRSWAGIVLLLLTAFLAYRGYYSAAGFTALTLHIHIFLNQIWHKMRSIEAFLDERLGGKE